MLHGDKLDAAIASYLNEHEHRFERHIFTNAAGVTFGNHQSAIRRLQQFEAVALIREPNNPYDPNAIAIERANGEAIGHLHGRLAEELAPEIDGGAHWMGIVSEVTGGVAGKPTRGVNLMIAKARPSSDLRAFNEVGEGAFPMWIIGVAAVLVFAVVAVWVTASGNSKSARGLSQEFEKAASATVSSQDVGELSSAISKSSDLRSNDADRAAYATALLYRDWLALAAATEVSVFKEQADYRRANVRNKLKLAMIDGHIENAKEYIQEASNCRADLAKQFANGKTLLLLGERLPAPTDSCRALPK